MMENGTKVKEEERKGADETVPLEFHRDSRDGFWTRMGSSQFCADAFLEVEVP
jgi:hypothetical protein